MIGNATTTVVHVAAYASPYSGSFVPMLRAAADWVAARGWTMEVVLPAGAAQCQWFDALAATTRVSLLPSKSLSTSGRQLRDIARRAPGDVIFHTHFLTFDFAAVFAAAGIDRAHVVWHKHGSLRQEPTAVARGVIKYGVIGRSVDAVVCVAPSVVGEMRRRGVPAARLHSIVNGIDVERFGPVRPDERAKARASLGLAANDRAILHFGWEWERKGGDLFLGAVKRLGDRGAQAVAISVLGGESARTLGAALGLGERLRVVDATEDVRRLYASADIFASPSRSEGMPFAILEALSSGLPVVATRIPPHEYFAHLSNVRLVAADDTELADGMSALLDRSEALTAESREEVRGWMLEHLTLDVWASKIGLVYEGILRPT